MWYKIDERLTFVSNFVLRSAAAVRRAYSAVVEFTVSRREEWRFWWTRTRFYGEQDPFDPQSMGQSQILVVVSERWCASATTEDSALLTIECCRHDTFLSLKTTYCTNKILLLLLIKIHLLGNNRQCTRIKKPLEGQECTYTRNIRECVMPTIIALNLSSGGWALWPLH